ncbi:MAG TPA: hypothetical protein PLS00_00160 [Niabella sp.]|nr:hypothetical protein [Niabella sp.]
MKPLDKLNNVEKGKLLFDLFPANIPKAIDFILAIAKMICNDPDNLKQQWENQFLTVEFWLRLATDTQQRIEKNGKSLHRSGSRFADQLFDGYNALFTVHCLGEYSVNEACTDKRFAKAIEMLF